MARYTEEESRRLHAMRDQERADDERRRTMWHAASVGHSESGTEYVIEYRHDDDPTWYSASPFYDPLRFRPEETHNKQEAEEIARLILAGKWAVTKQGDPGDYRITGVRVIERYASAKIIKHFS